MTATTRATEGIVVKDEKKKESTNGKANVEEGVNVLSSWPNTSIFVNEMMRRVFPIES